jgi:hypothetical protein
MKTRREILSTKAYGKIYRNQHIAELNALIKVPIQEENFMSVEDTDTFMNIRLMYVSRLKKTTPFSDKHILCSVIDCIANHYKGSVLFFSYYSEYCGMYVLNTIADFNCNFGFYDESKGLISLQTSNNNNRLVIDFYEEYNEYLLDIEVYGDLWCSIVKDILA